MRERVCMLEPRVGPLPLSASAMRASLFCPLQIALTNCSECETSKLEVSYKKTCWHATRGAFSQQPNDQQPEMLNSTPAGRWCF